MERLLLAAAVEATAIARASGLAALAAGAPGDGGVARDCWEECQRTTFYCPEFCCQPRDGLGNPTCWDPNGYYTYEWCCVGLPIPPEPSSQATMKLGRVVLPLYRGPSDHNQPRFNERTVEVALGLWFMRRSLRQVYAEGGGFAPLELGNVLGTYWPDEERVQGRYLPWQVADLGDNGLDATAIDSFKHGRILSISTVEHIGYDNEGAGHFHGFRVLGPEGFDAWVRAWEGAPALLGRVVREAAEFLVTFPLGFNPRLDAAVAQTPALRRFARVARRVDAMNLWEVDVNRSFLSYHYDFRDTYSSTHVGLMYDPELRAAYRRIFGQEMSELLPVPRHPRFRFANAVCIVTNLPELLRR